MTRSFSAVYLSLLHQYRDTMQYIVICLQTLCLDRPIKVSTCSALILRLLNSFTQWNIINLIEKYITIVRFQCQELIRMELYIVYSKSNSWPYKLIYVNELCSCILQKDFKTDIVFWEEVKMISNWRSQPARLNSTQLNLTRHLAWAHPLGTFFHYLPSLCNLSLEQSLCIACFSTCLQ